MPPSAAPIATAEAFCEQLDPGGMLTDREHKSLDSLDSLHLLFQLTDAELTAQRHLFDDAAAVETTTIHSYLFFAAELPAGVYTRTALSSIARAVNKPLPMPALVLLRHGDCLSLAIIHRRLNKRDSDRDVLEKATLIKDIRFADPIRAHVEILNDFAAQNLDADFGIHNFVSLHHAWQKRLGSYALNERFYREIADWYFWAIGHEGVTAAADDRQRAFGRRAREAARRLLHSPADPRYLLLVPAGETAHSPRPLPPPRRPGAAQGLFAPGRHVLQGILQNLFFATLNQEQENRDWRKKYKAKGARDGNRGVTNLWRCQDLLAAPDRLEALLRDHIPFVNGGLFDCLDDVRDDKKRPNVRLDDFSEERDNALCLPNELFFGEERDVDLSSVYDDQRRRREKVRGLIETLSRYKFTVEENTPLEEEIALDPELLGKVFENLLASYNDDTRTTARKALGAFYTPREIVHYMVDQALAGYLVEKAPSVPDADLKALFDARSDLPDFTATQAARNLSRPSAA